MNNIIEKPISKLKHIIRIIIAFIVLSIIGFFVFTSISFYIGSIIIILAIFSPYLTYKYIQLTSKRKKKNV